MQIRINVDWDLKWLTPARVAWVLQCVACAFVAYRFDSVTNGFPYYKYIHALPLKQVVIIRTVGVIIFVGIFIFSACKLAQSVGFDVA